ncbi:MAG: T9SS type A sorting domain-containing protein [Gemmatimonadaceae bacterium]|nr:T9SS type A sorting domain-containing protein [Gemmatimonadaceae bacterium]
MVARHRYWVVLVVLGSLGPGSLGWALPPCGPPGTITTVTAPDGGDYIAAFRDYKIYPPEPLSFLEGVVDLVAEPDYRSYYPQALALGPQGRVHVADMTIIYRLEDDGTATRIVGVPQYSARETDADGWREPLLRETNVLQDTVAALEARIAPGPMAFDRQGRLYFVDYVNRRGTLRTEARIARLEADGQVTTFAARVESGPFSSLLFEPGGHLLVGGMGGIQRIDTQGVVSWLRVVSWAGALRLDAEGRLYFANGRKIYRLLDDGTLEVVAGSETPLRVFDFVIDARGVLYLPDFESGRIHRVGADGILETIAGDGRDYRYIPACFAGKRVAAGKRLSRHRCRDQMGDGGPALDAPIWEPFLVLLAPEGDLLVAMYPPSSYSWDGGTFSFLRRICGVSEPAVPTSIETVDQDSSPSHPEGGSPSLRLYPNPSNASVTLAYHLDQSANVSVRIYDELGQRVRVLAAEAERPAGDYQYVWDGRDREGRRQASGTYFLVLSIDGVQDSRKLTLLH